MNTDRPASNVWRKERVQAAEKLAQDEVTEIFNVREKLCTRGVFNDLNVPMGVEAPF